MKSLHWQNAVIVAVGAGLVFVALFTNIMPRTQSLSNGAVWNFVIVGLALAALAFASMLTDQAWEEWAILLVSFWLAISPWVLGYALATSYVETALLASSIIVVIAGFTAIWSGGASRY